MYNFKIQVNYKDSDNDDIYRTQLCKCFDVEEYQHEIFMSTMKEIFETFRNNSHFNKLVKFAVSKFGEPEELYAFMYLFSWDYFELLHKCLIDLENTHAILDTNLNNLLNI
tara:strand:- start:9 stop:341 length:333 start_codon:yes stop_codon:yes gene_type:complete